VVGAARTSAARGEQCAFLVAPMSDKRLLMIAYHFPPLAGSSGIQRTLRLVQQLPRLGWTPLVLTADRRAYERTATDLERDVPTGTVVRRAFALDAARHLAVRGRYLSSLARPDRWTSWRYDGVRQGMKLVRQFEPMALWSTFPIATAHVIAAELNARTGIPWVADFRDPMAQEGYPPDPLTWKQYRAIEQRAVERASCCVFTTPGAARMYREPYPEASDRIVTIENGYDEESFAGLGSKASSALHAGAITLLHSGIVYPSERDPSQLFAAWGNLRRSGRVAPGTLKIRFRASNHDDLLRRLAVQHGVADDIELSPAVGYREALAEMLSADGLLVLQAANCNEQIPAKVYEYLRAGRPILCLSDPDGDTAQLLRSMGIDTMARLDSVREIESRLPTFMDAVRSRCAPLPRPEAVHRLSRTECTRTLAERLDDVVRSSSASSRHSRSLHTAA
jgi:glycosyltransferase involved in cell wall biosynthesis